MKRYALETIGCRLNQYESERLAASLNHLGLKRVAFGEEPDIYLINTCTVTGRADASCRQTISRAARLKKNSPVVVIGCYVEAEPEKIARLNGVDLVIRNSEKDNAVDILRRSFPDLFESDISFEGENVISEFHEHNRAWVKIGDGCDQHCAYCIIPRVRGPLVNRPEEDIIREINSLVRNGYKEVVLTGVHIGRYAGDRISSLSELLKLVMEKTSLLRVRLSSLEPQEISSDIIETIGGSRGRVCRHLHIPLQSGADRILKLMKRPYNRNKFLSILEQAKNNIPGLIIGIDVIVGFPGETDEDFEESVRAASSGLVDYIHVFSYSDRPGTAATDMKDKVPPEVIKTRNRILRELSDKLYAAALQREIGRDVQAISESRVDRKDGSYLGVTDNYLTIKIPPPSGGGRDIISLKAGGATATYLTAQESK